MQGPPRAEVQVSRALCAHRGGQAAAPELLLCPSASQAGKGGVRRAQEALAHSLKTLTHLPGIHPWKSFPTEQTVCFSLLPSSRSGQGLRTEPPSHLCPRGHWGREVRHRKPRCTKGVPGYTLQLTAEMRQGRLRRN